MRALKAKEEWKKMGTDVYKSVVKSEGIKMNKLLQGLKQKQKQKE